MLVNLQQNGNAPHFQAPAFSAISAGRFDRVQVSEVRSFGWRVAELLQKTTD